MITRIKNCKVLNADCSAFFESDIYIRDGKILKISNDDIGHDKEIDANNSYIIPGFIDIHTHGAYGHVYFESPNFQEALEWNCKRGITTVIPTIGTYAIKEMTQYAHNIVSQSKNSKGASIRGIHFEGPFISSQKKGAMFTVIEDKCSIEAFDTLVSSAEGFPVMMTIAPELENAIEVIEHASSKGVRMSLGHSMATYEEAIRV
jgi:N-acetylglucosamine-6-phosphate deacetylase